MIHRKHTIGCLITTLLVVFFLNSMCYSGWPTDFTDRSIGNIIIVDIMRKLMELLLQLLTIQKTTMDLSSLLMN